MTHLPSARRPRLRLVLSAEERTWFLNGCLDRLRELVDFEEDSGLGAEILVTGWSTPWLGERLRTPAGPVRYICHLTGSVRNVVPRSFIEEGGRVTNWGALASAAVAEHALLLALAALRNLTAWRRVIAEPRVDPPAVVLGTRTLIGRRVGIHGCGAVAQALARLLQPFGSKLRVYSGGVSADFIRSLGLPPSPTLDELFRGSDVLFECEALVPPTAGSVGARQLALLPNHAVFVNVGRGEVVDESALLAEAAGGRIRLALDVVAMEPLSATDPLVRAEGAILSPHIAGPTTDQYLQIGEFALGNIARFVAGQKLQNQVTIEIYDRST